MLELREFKGNKVEIIVESGEPLFEVYSTGMALGHGKTNKMGVEYPRRDRINANLKSAEIKPCVRGAKLYITESQLYDLMLEMKTEKVKPFRKWVTNNVLPTIRKTGGYVSNANQFVDTYFKGVDTKQRALLSAILEASKQQSNTIKELTPKADYCDKVLLPPDTITPTELGKLFGMSPQKFHKTCNDLGIMYKVGKTWVLYRKYQNKGYTKVRTYCDGAGHPHESTHFTQLGKKFIVDEFSKIGIVVNGGNE